MNQKIEAETGDTIVVAGIYQCKKCKKEFTFKKGDIVKDCDKCGDDEFILIKEL